MAFLDNSGDIILDAVLTDTGRLRMARGDGSFRITKFAFGDDEINYATYDGAHLSGSAYYDLEILQTPIFEAFTNNTSTMKSKLISLTNNNLLYLPVIKQNTLLNGTDMSPITDPISQGLYTVYVNVDTRDELSAAKGNANIAVVPGFINGFQKENAGAGNYIRVDQGLDTNKVSANFSLDPELKEKQYLVEVDSRFLFIYDLDSLQNAQESFIDDDLMATYYFTQNIGDYIKDLQPNDASGNPPSNGDQNIQGPRGTFFQFGLQAASDVKTSTYLFDTLGVTVTQNGKNFSAIDTNVRITGVTTGYRIDIPVRILRETN